MTHDVINDIAIIGISGMFPKAHNCEELWDNLCVGKDAIDEIPKERWDIEEYYSSDSKEDGKTISKWGGFLHGIEYFDPAFFNLTESEARHMDPQHRLCLQESWRVIEDSGYSPSSLSGKNVSVFIGARSGDYIKNGMSSSPVDTLMGNDAALLSAKISYFFNFKGPCMTIDTACSSSLVALHQACQSLRYQESEISLVGGVCVTLSPQSYITTSKLKIFSPTGKCKSFDDDANGMVQGEGVCFVMLKPLNQALQDKDTIQGIIRGSGVNFDGRTNGIAAPSSHSQTKLQTSIYRRFNLNPKDITYVETHGTGTKLGDPNEIDALTNSFQQFGVENKQQCFLGCIKPNIGHLTAAAGLAAVIKVILAFKYQKIPMNINFEVPNKFIDFQGSPFQVITKTQDWTLKSSIAVRLAAINSFGLGGTNAHCVLQEPPIRRHNNEAKKPFYMILFSAKSQHDLVSYMHVFCVWLKKNKIDKNLRDISYTSLVGRDWFDYRKVFIASSIDNLVDQLNIYIESKNTCYEQNHCIFTSENIDQLLQDVDLVEFDKNSYLINLKKLAEYVSVDKNIFSSIHAIFLKEPGYRINMPVYQFSGDFYWIN